MINATHGAGGFHAAGLTPSTSGPAQPHGSGGAAQPAIAPRTGPHVPAPASGNARRLQMLARASQTADTAAAAAAGTGEPPHVGPHTTVLDTLRWNTKANLAGNEHRLMLGQPVGDPRLGGAQANAPIRLGMHDDPHAPVHPQAAAAGRHAALRILDNTERDLALQGTPAGREIAMARHWLSQPGNHLTAASFAGMMRAVGEAIHTDYARAIGPSSAPRTGGRMPMECVTHLAHQARAAMATATPAQRDFLARLGHDAMGRALQHNLSVADTKAWLTAVAAGSRAAGLPGLAGLAEKLDTQIPAAATAATHGTRMHDNMYGRALESALIGRLVDNPPPGVRQSMNAMGGHLNGMLHTLPPGHQEWVAGEIQKLMRAEPRSWEHASPKLMALAHADTPAATLAALKNVLQQPAANGADCLAIPYLTVKMSLTMDRVGAAPWMQYANQNYSRVICAASARDSNMAPNFNRWTPKAGITSHHQPDIVPQYAAAIHPGDRNTPKLQTPSHELTLALEQGVPFVSGVSGSTNITMFMVDHMRKTGTPIDSKDALLGTMMFLTHDGGHSMHEAMWVGNQLDAPLGLGMGMPGGAPGEFVADYQGFLHSFPPEKGGHAMHAAMTGAWDQTLNHFGQHSHFTRHSE